MWIAKNLNSVIEANFMFSNIGLVIAFRSQTDNDHVVRPDSEFPNSLLAQKAFEGFFSFRFLHRYCAG
jgi:hypothetical protein